MKTIKTIIEQHSFTKHLDPKYLHLLEKSATYERFGAQQTVFQESFEADRFYFIHRGRVALHTFAPGQGVVTIQTIGPNETLGWSWLFPPHRWHFSAIAVEPTEAVALCAATMRQEMEENHDFGYAIAMRVGQLILERLQATRTRMLEVYNVAG